MAELNGFHALWIAGAFLMGCGLGTTIGMALSKTKISFKYIHTGCCMIIIIGYLMGYWALKNLGA